MRVNDVFEGVEEGELNTNAGPFPLPWPLAWPFDATFGLPGGPLRGCLNALPALCYNALGRAVCTSYAEGEMNSPSWFERIGVVEWVRQSLAERASEGYIVGGYVRDLLLGRETRDLDLVVSRDALALAQETANELGGAFVLLDEERHTARVVLLDGGQRFYVDFAALRGGGLPADLSGRDFTVNAMAIDVQHTGPEPHVVDPCAGQRDLESRTLRAVSDSVFEDDAIRLLRGVRLAGELEFEVEGHTEQLMARDASLITGVSAERVRDELYRILNKDRSESSLRYLDRLGLLTRLLPELDPLRGLEQPRPHFQDGFEHSLASVRATDWLLESIRRLACGEEPPTFGESDVDHTVCGHFVDAVDPFVQQLAAYIGEELVGERHRLVLLKMAALLHDVGKAGTAKVDEEDRVRFLGHAPEGAAMAARVLRRLRFGNREVRLVHSAVRHHMRPLQLATLDTISRRAIYRFFRDAGSAGLDVLLLSLGDSMALVHEGSNVEQWERISGTVGVLVRAYYERYEQIVEPAPLLSGGDLLEHFSMESGPEVGRLLRALKEAQAAGEVSTREQALRLADSLMSRRRQ